MSEQLTVGQTCICGGSLTSYNQRNHRFCNVVEPQEVNLTMTLAHKPECTLLQPVMSTNTEQKSCDCGYEDSLAYVKYQIMTINHLTSQLATITEERDKLKLQLAGRTYCHSDEQINEDLVAAEEALDKMMTLNDKLTGDSKEVLSRLEMISDYSLLSGLTIAHDKCCAALREAKHILYQQALKATK